MDERTKKLKAELNSIILRIQHKTGAIEFGPEYLEVIHILTHSFIKQKSVNDLEAEFVSSYINSKELYYKGL